MTDGVHLRVSDRSENGICFIVNGTMPMQGKKDTNLKCKGEQWVHAIGDTVQPIDTNLCDVMSLEWQPISQCAT